MIWSLRARLTAWYSLVVVVVLAAGAVAVGLVQDRLMLERLDGELERALLTLDGVMRTEFAEGRASRPPPTKPAGRWPPPVIRWCWHGATGRSWRAGAAAARGVAAAHARRRGHRAAGVRGDVAMRAASLPALVLGAVILVAAKGVDAQPAPAPAPAAPAEPEVIKKGKVEKADDE
jgi:hypothetical protein